ncbi:MAG: hypothetical protein AAFR41_07905, partial [Pseudomonadota bacterium]
MPTCGCVVAGGGWRDFIPPDAAEDPGDLGLVGEDAEGLGMPGRGSDRFAHGGAVDLVFPGDGAIGPPGIGDVGPAPGREAEVDAGRAKF